MRDADRMQAAHNNADTIAENLCRGLETRCLASICCYAADNLKLVGAHFKTRALDKFFCGYAFDTLEYNRICL